MGWLFESVIVPFIWEKATDEMIKHIYKYRFFMGIGVVNYLLLMVVE
jgi:hypothetical protein